MPQSLFILRFNSSSVDAWKEQIVVHQKVFADLGAKKMLVSPSVMNNLPSVVLFVTLPSENKDAFLNFFQGDAAADVPPPVLESPLGKLLTAPVQIEEFQVDFELGYGGSKAMAGSAVLVCTLTLVCAYDDFKAIFFELKDQLYPGCSKAFVCRVGDDQVSYVVVFPASHLAAAKALHSSIKPTPIRSLIEEGQVKEVTSLEWYGLLCAVDRDNYAGPEQKIKIFGRINDAKLAKLSAACEQLQRSQETFSADISGLIEAEFELVVKTMTATMPGKSKDHLRVHAGGPLVLCNGEYVGSIREFELWALERYQYADNTPEYMYRARGRKALAAYMEAQGEDADFVFLDLAVLGAENKADPINPRVIIQLHRATLPKTCENFLTLAEESYAGSPFHRVTNKAWIQGGAVGDESIYGGVLEDESFAYKHVGPGDVGMASTGPHSNATQFYITLDKLDWLDNKKVVFGRVVDGLKAVRQVGRAEVRGWNQRPLQTHYIASSGRLQAADLNKGRKEGALRTEGGPNDDEGRPPQGVREEGADTAAAVSSANDHQDQAERAALQLQKLGRGWKDRKRAKAMAATTLPREGPIAIPDVSADQLWAALSDWTGAGLVEQQFLSLCDLQGPPAIGSVRKLVTAEGMEIEETLLSNNAKHKCFSYAYTGPRAFLESQPFEECTMNWKVEADGEGCKVKCTAKYVLKAEQEYQAEAVEPMVVAIVEACCNHAKGVAP